MDSKSLYFFITYSQKQKENSKDVHFISPENNKLKPLCIYINEQYENQLYNYIKIFKVNKSAGKGKKGNIVEDKYIINDLIQFLIKLIK